MEFKSMAISLGDRNQKIKVISSVDDSITCSDEDYQKYLRTLDESLLGLKEGVEPTRFVMKRFLKKEEDTKVKREQFDKITKAGASINLSFVQKTVQMALVAIEEDPALLDSEKIGGVWKDGYLDEETVCFLDQVGIVSDLYAARQFSVQGDEDARKKK